MIKLTVNGKTYETDAEPDTPLLWVIREQVGLTGTEYIRDIKRKTEISIHEAEESAD